MVERGDPKPERQRIRKLAQAALNADVTVDQLTTIIVDMGDTLEGVGQTVDGMNVTIASLDETLTRMSETLDQVDLIAARMNDVVVRMERVVGRVEAIVDIGEVAIRPLGALESVGRSVAGRLGLK
ncbi:hypothetical protein QSJ18_17035 [Gordonia sp. ABSL1-1]|uniref:hypothetical protein n=1 Tax=Gordonia sp. ABSL1-1 TaxID=3053923 RepID=UPI0025723EB1|nr:hypothetical protein [Gordonia sp. ABSL1-1]MDL9938455.1 hypothetical protein [Gordonia sp. ABSL1-1]